MVDVLKPILREKMDLFVVSGLLFVDKTGNGGRMIEWLIERLKNRKIERLKD